MRGVDHHDPPTIKLVLACKHTDGPAREANHPGERAALADRPIWNDGMTDVNHHKVNHTTQSGEPEGTHDACQVLIKMPAGMGTICRTVNTKDSPIEWVPSLQNLHTQGWKVHINGNPTEWHQPCNLATGSTNFCVFKAYPLKGGAAGMRAEQKMDIMLQMMAHMQQGQAHMQQGQTEALGLTWSPCMANRRQSVESSM